MDITHYTFAFFVFVLVCVTIWFYSRLIRKKKNESSEYQKEQRIYKLYQNVEDMMTGFEEYVEEVKAELDSKVSQITSNLENVKVNQNVIDQISLEFEKPVEINAEVRQPPKDEPKDEPKPKENAQKMVEELLEKGVELDEIAKKLEMSRRELSLIMKFKSGRKKNS